MAGPFFCRNAMQRTTLLQSMKFVLKTLQGLPQGVSNKCAKMAAHGEPHCDPAVPACDFAAGTRRVREPRRCFRFAPDLHASFQRFLFQPNHPNRYGDCAA
jgi:hypothetical protein